MMEDNGYNSEGIEMMDENAPSMLKNETVVANTRRALDHYFQRFESDSQDIRDQWLIADQMYACASSRSFLSSEKSKGMNLEKDTRSNVGSPLYKQGVDILSSLLVNILSSRDSFYKYDTIGSDGVAGSKEDGLQDAQQRNILSKWTLKQQGFNAKLPELATMLHKYSFAWLGVRMRREYRDEVVIVQEPTGDIFLDPVTGTEVVATHDVAHKQRVICKNYPEFYPIHPDMIYCDRYVAGPSVSEQNCVFFLSLPNWSEVYSNFDEGYWDKSVMDQVKRDTWDGVYGNREQALERERHSVSGATIPDSDLFLQWDAFVRLPVDDSGNWDENAAPRRYWVTLVGNTVANAKIVRFERNPEPDDEIPIVGINTMADRLNELYHTAVSEVARSLYSSDCTLLNLSLDNMALVNSPPMTVLDGEHRIRDFTLRKGALFHVNRHDALLPMQFRDVTQNTVALREAVKREMLSVMNISPSLLGEFAGARTSATEFQAVNQNVRQPHMTQARYIINQFAPWMARKMARYWQVFGTDEQVVQISDQDKFYKIRPKQLSGDFDVVADIVDEYEADATIQQQAATIIQTIGSSPFFQQSASHTVDAGELLKVFLESMKWKTNRIILPATGTEAEDVARSRVSNMLNGGQYVPPKQGENLQVHIRIASGERLRWRGLEDSDDPRARNLPFLDQYISQLKNMMSSGPSMAPGAQPEASPEQVMQQKIEGGLQGAMMGQQPPPSG